MKVYSKLLSQTVVYGFATIFTRVLNYVILTPYLTRRLVVAEYGILTDLYAYAAVLMVILLYGLETGFFRFAEKYKDKKDLVFGTVLSSVTLTTLIFLTFIVGFHKPIASLLKYEDHSIYIILFGSILSFDVISAIFLAKLRQENRAFRFAWIHLINVLVSIGVMLALFELDMVKKWEWLQGIFGRHSVVLIPFVANLLASGVKLSILLVDLIKIKIRFNRVLLKQILLYSLPLLVSGLGGILNEMFDRVVYKYKFEDTEVFLHDIGIYGAVYKLGVLITLFIQMFRYAAEPFFFSLYKNKDSKTVYANVLVYFLIFTIGILLFVIYYLDYFKYFIDPSYHEGLFVVPIILLSNVILGLLFNVNFWFKLSGQTKYAMIIMGIGAIVNITINILFIEKYRYVACAYAHLVSNSSMLIASYLIGQRKYRINYDLKKILFYSILGGLFYFGFVVLTNIGIYNVVFGTVMLILFFIIAIYKEKLVAFIKYGRRDY